jgi:hypothetical protein
VSVRDDALDLIHEALAHEIVSLATSPLQTLLGASDAQWRDIAAQLGPLMDEVERIWREAGATAAQHIFLVMRNNPDESLASLYDRRADIRQVLDTPVRTATAYTHQLIDDAWDAGRGAGADAGRGDLRALGLPTNEEGEVSTRILDQLHADAQNNGDAARQRFLDAVVSDDPTEVRAALNNVGNKQALRARAGVSTSGTYAWGESKERTLMANAPPGSMKVWVCSFINSCGTCVRLHGTRRKLGEPFPATVSFTKPTRVYGGTLNHPPRHVSCRCRLVLWVPKVGSTSSMLTYAQEFWEGVKEAIRGRRRGQG